MTNAHSDTAPHLSDPYKLEAVDHTKHRPGISNQRYLRTYFHSSFGINEENLLYVCLRNQKEETKKFAVIPVTKRTSTSRSIFCSMPIGDFKGCLTVCKRRKRQPSRDVPESLQEPHVCPRNRLIGTCWTSGVGSRVRE